MSIDSAAAALETRRSAPAFRPTLQGTRHMVVAGHYLAAQAAFQVLEAGGNAVDAGVAAGITLGVVQSDFVNIAGVAPIMIFLAGERRVVTIDGLGTWPAVASLDRYIGNYGGLIPKGLARTVVPAAPDAWIRALSEFGSMSFGDVAAAAIRFARDGFAMYPLMAEIIAAFESDYRQWPSSAAVYLPNGRPPQVGERFVQADLAATLQFMADEERCAAQRGRSAGLVAARDAFYKGDIAATIADFHARNGGLLAYADMADFSCRLEPPAQIRFRDMSVYSCGPWCQGPVLLQMLSILDGFDLVSLRHNSTAYVHLVTEAMKLAFADREAWYGDPRFVEVPLDVLLSNGYAQERRRLMRSDRASEGLPPPGFAPAVRPSGGSRPPAAGALPVTALDTSYVCVVDRHGNAFSATPSDVSTDTPVVPGTGLCPSSRGSQSWAVAGHPSCIAPGKRPRLTPNPAIVICDDGRLIPLGTPGGDVQCQAMLQVLLNRLLFRMECQEAVEAPRFATFSFPNSSEPHATSHGLLMLEARVDSSVSAALTAIGHTAQPWPEWTWRAGGVCIIDADSNAGLMSGGADPRRPSYAIGW
jgi:gamma-glutamyltranspeptidase / glutathione hydrolase